MKNRTTILLVCLLVALAQGDVINWSGNWDLKTIESEDACYPAGTILITQDVATITASWTWDNTQPCIDAKIANTQFTQTVPTPTGNKIALKIKVGDAEIDGTFTVNADAAIFVSQNKASSTYARRQLMVNWDGTWDIATQDEKLCNPAGSIVITKVDGTSVRAQWAWAKTKPCTDIGLTQDFNQVVTISGNAATINIQVGEAIIQGIFAVIRDQAVFFNANGGASTFIRKQENVAFVGTWDIQTQASETACYPAKSIVITQSGGDVTAKWTWADSVPCKSAGLDGKEFSQSTPSPKGRAIFLDIVVGATTTTITRISGLFSVSGDSATFDSTLGASATFTRVSGGPSGGGYWVTIIIILLVIVALGVAGYLYVQNRNKKLQGANLDNSTSGAYTRT